MRPVGRGHRAVGQEMDSSLSRFKALLSVAQLDWETTCASDSKEKDHGLGKGADKQGKDDKSAWAMAGR